MVVALGEIIFKPRDVGLVGETKIRNKTVAVHYFTRKMAEQR